MPLRFLVQLARKKDSVRSKMPTRIIGRLAVSVFLLLCTLPLFATTLVVKLEDDRIILAADTREQRFNPGPSAMIQSPGDDSSCKVRVMGQIGFAVTGFVDYVTTDNSDPLHGWSAYADAASAFVKGAGNIRLVASEWAQETASHFNALYKTSPDQVKQLAGTNPDNLLQIAFFAGWENRTPVLLLEIVFFDPKSPQPIGVREIDHGVGRLAFSSNAVTQELIDGTSDRAEKAADEWDTMSETIPTSDLAWRHVEFYVKKTANYDSRVSPIVDVLSIPVGKPPEWVQRAGCQ
jgi:hypothetical protein